MYNSLPENEESIVQSGLYAQLSQDQVIENIGQKNINLAFVNERLPFIGTIGNDAVSSMGCLLEDGSFLTTLHSIYDLKARQSYILQNMRIFFVKGRDVFSYGVRQVLHDEFNAYANNAATYDYALLELDGNPLNDLGVGLKLDSTNHWGSAFVTDPMATLAISAPCFSRNEEGQNIVTRYCSIAENEAAKAGPYMFPQMGHHPAKPGMSGQGIFSNDGNLYAIHVGFDHQAQSRFGFKISEYQAAVKQNLSISSHYSTARPFSDTVDLEANKNSQRRQNNIAVGNSRLAAMERTHARMEDFSDSKYKVMSSRDLALYFPELGLGIFNLSRTNHTNSNKTEYYNPITRWSLCYDKYGKYNTVINEKGHHVALDRTTSVKGDDEKYHFYNTAKEKDFGPSVG